MHHQPEVVQQAQLLSAVIAATMGSTETHAATSEEQLGLQEPHQE